MGKVFTTILLLTFLIPYPTYCQHDLHQLSPQEVGAGVGLSSTDLWTQVGGKLYYGLANEVTGYIFGSARFLKEDPLLATLDIDFSPSTGVGMGASSRSFSDGSNVGYWTSGFISRRWAKAEQKHYQINSIKGKATGFGLAGGVAGRVATQGGSMFYPFAGASYNIEEVSWEGSLISGMRNERYTDLGGVMGMEARTEGLSILGFVNFSLEGGGTSFVISALFRQNAGIGAGTKAPDMPDTDTLGNSRPNPLGSRPDIRGYAESEEEFKEKFPFKKARWGMTKEEVRKSETAKFVGANAVALLYDDTALGLKFRIIYIFVEHKLSRVEYHGTK